MVSPGTIGVSSASVIQFRSTQIAVDQASCPRSRPKPGGSGSRNPAYLVLRDRATVNGKGTTTDKRCTQWEPAMAGVGGPVQHCRRARDRGIAIGSEGSRPMPPSTLIAVAIGTPAPFNRRCRGMSPPVDRDRAVDFSRLQAVAMIGNRRRL